MSRSRKDVIKNNEISEVVTLMLGGYPQKVLIEGRTSNLPIVVQLHGGPGSPIPFGVGCRGMFPEYTDKFLMLCWDQLGCGANNHEIDDSFNVERFVDMTVELVHAIKERFPGNKLVLLGTSWGSVLSLRAAVRLSGEIDAAVAWGQLIKNTLCSDNVFAALEASAMPELKKQEVLALKSKPITPDTVKYLAGCVEKYTDGYMNKKGGRQPMLSMVLGLLTSPDYRFRDFIAAFSNGTSKNSSLWTELIDMDLSGALASVTIPYYILQGDTDIVTDTEIVVNAAQASGNPNVVCRVLPNCGHFPNPDAMNAVMETMLELANGENN